MTVVARRIRATPIRTTTDSWAVIVDLIAADHTMRPELEAAGNVAAMLIAEEHTASNPMVLTGCGAHTRLYTLHGLDAIDGSNANEQSLQITPTDEWELSLPAADGDFDLAAEAVAGIDHVTVYDPAINTAHRAATSNHSVAHSRVAVDLNVLED